MAFVWDDEKEKINIKKHGISFRIATKVFDDPDCLIEYDSEHSLDEDRYRAIGMIGKILCVIHTVRGEDIRIISARIATESERRRYNVGKND